MKEYFEREIIKETEKAYMIKYNVSNRFANVTKFKWIPKSVCGEITEFDYPEFNLHLKYVQVPETWIPDTYI